MRYRDEDGNEIKLKNIPDALGRGKDGRITRGMKAHIAKQVADYGRDESGRKDYRKVKGGKTPDNATQKALIKKSRGKTLSAKEQQLIDKWNRNSK